MSYCPKCGSEVSKGTKFCAQCGENLTATTKRKPADDTFNSEPLSDPIEVASQPSENIHSEGARIKKGGFGGAVFWIIIFLAIGGYFFYDNSNSSSPSDPVVNTSAAVFINELQTDGQLTFKVNAEPLCGLDVLGSDGNSLSAQGQFCKINLSVLNHSKSANDFYITDAKLVDAQKNKYDASTDASLYTGDTTFDITTINPGNSITGNVYFDIPKGIVPKYLEVHDSTFSNGSNIELINKPDSSKIVARTSNQSDLSVIQHVVDGFNIAGGQGPLTQFKFVLAHDYPGMLDKKIALQCALGKSPALPSSFQMLNPLYKFSNPGGQGEITLKYVLHLSTFKQTQDLRVGYSGIKEFDPDVRSFLNLAESNAAPLEGAVVYTGTITWTDFYVNGTLRKTSDSTEKFIVQNGIAYMLDSFC